MKCTNCGAIVDIKTMTCEYCGYVYEKPKKIKKPGNQLWSTLAISITIILVVAIVFVVLPLVGSFWLYDKYADEYKETAPVYIVNKLPKGAKDLIGVMGECTTDGVTTIYHNDEAYGYVQIADSGFVDWLLKKGIDPNGRGIMFSTDDDGNINDIYLKHDDFIVMYREGNNFVAFGKDEKIIAFETDMELQTDVWYTGYWSYSGNQLHSVEETDCYESYGRFYYKCNKKETPTERCAISNKEVMVYKMMIGNDWIYCSKDTYDAINVGDDLRDDYTFMLALPYVYKKK